MAEDIVNSILSLARAPPAKSNPPGPQIVVATVIARTGLGNL